MPEQKKYILKLTKHDALMEDYPADAMSIDIRERMVQPLLTIQQFVWCNYANLSTKYMISDLCMKN